VYIIIHQYIKYQYRNSFVTWNTGDRYAAMLLPNSEEPRDNEHKDHNAQE